MAKRDKEVITLGSCTPYLMEYDGETVPTESEVCIESNKLGDIKGGAAVEYTEETYEEKDDLGRKSKIITTKEDVKVKLGLLVWNGNTLNKLIDRSSVTEKDGKRVTKIGGAGNAKGKNYVLCLHQEDKQDGDLWVLIVGKNTAGASLAFATDKGTLLEPEFTAMPHDDKGTLLQLIEEIGTGTVQAAAPAKADTKPSAGA